MSPPHHYRYAITARDPASGRSQTRHLSAQMAETPHTWMLTNLLIQIATTIGRSWLQRYGSPFPTSRVEWTVRKIHDPERNPAA